MKQLLPQTVSARQVQRHYRQVFDQAQKEPVVVLTNNHPDVVIIGIDQASKLYQKAENNAFDKIIQAIESYRE